jgi:hypothetical protein
VQRPKDAIVLADTIERAETVRHIQNASVKDLSTAKPFDLKQAYELACKRVEEQTRLAEELAKKLKQPLKKLNESVSEMEAVKTKIELAEDSALLSLGQIYEESYNKHRKACAEIQALDPNVTIGYDAIPTNLAQRLSWLSAMRQIWRQKRGVR